MSLDLVREIMKENRVVSRDSVQIIIENDIIVPDTKPDIGRILFADGDAYILHTIVDDGNILMDGIIRHKILYAEDSPEQNITALNVSTDFDHSMDVPGIIEGMEGRVKCNIEHVECRIVNGRKVNVRAILRIKSKIIEENEYYYINDVEDNENIQILRNSVSINKFIGTGQDVCIIKESFEVPSGNPSIREILRNDIRIVDIECKATDNKMILKGDANIQTLYTGDDGERSIKFMEHEITFTQVLDLPGIDEGSEIQIGYEVQNYSFEPLEDEDGELRFMDGEIHVMIQAIGSIKEEMDIITDTYGVRTDLSLESVKVSIEELVAENKSQAVIKETLTAEDDSPEIIEIFNVFSRPVLSEYEVEEDIIHIEGIVTNHILYYSNSPEHPVFCRAQDIPLRQSVEVKGIKPGMACEVDLEIEHSNYSMLSPKDVEVRLVTGINSRFYNTVEVSFIEKIVESPIDEGKAKELRPSITLYFVQEGDSLWDIAKKYRTTTDDIIRENKIEDENSINSGMQVLISRK